jgi:hypothetical protein
MPRVWFLSVLRCEIVVRWQIAFSCVVLFGVFWYLRLVIGIRRVHDVRCFGRYSDVEGKLYQSVAMRGTGAVKLRKWRHGCP